MKIIQKIRNSFEQLSPSKKKVASYFLNHYSTLYLDTVMGLSEKIGVSDTTIINFCMKRDMRKWVRDMIAADLL